MKRMLIFQESWAICRLWTFILYYDLGMQNRGLLTRWKNYWQFSDPCWIMSLNFGESSRSTLVPQSESVVQATYWLTAGRVSGHKVLHRSDKNPCSGKDNVPAPHGGEWKTVKTTSSPSHRCRSRVVGKSLREKQKGERIGWIGWGARPIIQLIVIDDV